MAKGYWIGHVTVHQPDRYPEYIKAATPAYQHYGAKFLVRGGEHLAVEGQSRSRNVVIEFPSYQAAQDCYNSPEYAAARAIRQQIADADMLIIEGHDS